MVIKETTDLLDPLYGDTLQRITIERVVVGVYFTGIKLSNCRGGISYAPVADLIIRNSQEVARRV